MNIVSSLNFPNTYYIFRENNVEVRVFVNGSKIFSNKTLRKHEREYINNNYIKGRKTPYAIRKINTLNEDQLKIVEQQIRKIIKEN